MLPDGTWLLGDTGPLFLGEKKMKVHLFIKGHNLEVSVEGGKRIKITTWILSGLWGFFLFVFLFEDGLEKVSLLLSANQ